MLPEYVQRKNSAKKLRSKYDIKHTDRYTVKIILDLKRGGLSEAQINHELKNQGIFKTKAQINYVITKYMEHVHEELGTFIGSNDLLDQCPTIVSEVQNRQQPPVNALPVINTNSLDQVFSELGQINDIRTIQRMKQEATSVVRQEDLKIDEINSHIGLISEQLQRIKDGKISKIDAQSIRDLFREQNVGQQTLIDVMEESTAESTIKFRT